MSKLKQIYEGWKNLIIPNDELKEEIEKVRNSRLEICKGCEFNSTKGEINNTSICTGCNCHLKAKASCLSCSCIYEKWKDELIRIDELDIILTDPNILNNNPNNNPE